MGIYFIFERNLLEIVFVSYIIVQFLVKCGAGLLYASGQADTQVRCRSKLGTAIWANSKPGIFLCSLVALENNHLLLSSHVFCRSTPYVDKLHFLLFPIKLKVPQNFMSQIPDFYIYASIIYSY